jgi:alkylhydroperoxidase family enzyme
MPPNLPYVDRSAVAPEVGQALEGLPDLNLFRMVAHAESAFVPWLRYGGALLTSLDLDPLERELAILRVAALMGSEYEWVQHAEITVRVGGSEEQVQAVERGELDSALFDARQQALLRFTGDVVERRPPGTLAGTHTPREVVELLLVIGHYTGIALLAEATGIETDAPAGLGR